MDIFFRAHIILLKEGTIHEYLLKIRKHEKEEAQALVHRLLGEGERVNLESHHKVLRLIKPESGMSQVCLVNNFRRARLDPIFDVVCRFEAACLIYNR